jgi:phenol/toluene 2-monooxygenase (NADH) P2/A2
VSHTQAAGASQRTVGIDLQASEEARAIIQAIEEDNPGVSVTEIPGVIRLQAPGELVIRRRTVARLMGRDWETLELQLALVSYYGNFDFDDDEILIKWEH